MTSEATEQTYFQVCGCLYVDSADLATALTAVLESIGTRTARFTIRRITEHADGSKTEWPAA